MNKRRRFVVMLTGVAALCLALSLTAVAGRSDTTGGIRGYVQDENGKMLPEAKVSVADAVSGAIVATHSTDKYGFFVFSGFHPIAILLKLSFRAIRIIVRPA